MTSYIFSASFTPATSTTMMFDFKQLLKVAGWTVPSSSDGTTFSSGDILNSPSDLANTDAWFILRQPLDATASYGGVQREFAIQRGSADDDWRGKYSYSASFTGSADASTLPDADDQVRFWGEELPSFGVDLNFFSSNGSYKVAMAADTKQPFGWYLFNYSHGGDVNQCLVFEPMAVGTTASQDKDPYVIYVSDSSTFSLDAAGGDMTDASTGSTISHPACWMKKGQSDEKYTGVAAMRFTQSPDSYGDGNNQGTTNPHNNNDDLLPIIWYRDGSLSTPSGYKGVSRQMRMAVTPARATLSTVSTGSASSRDFIIARSVALPWDGTIPKP